MIEHNPPPDVPEKESTAPVLNGTVRRYFADIKMGTIRSDGGQIYTFHRSDWLLADEPKAGVRVSFELNGDTPVKIKVA